MPVTIGGKSNPVHSAKISGGVRAVSTEAQLVWIVDPKTGDKQEVARHVANDMVAHCGWKWATKTGEAPTVKDVVSLGDGTVITSTTDEDPTKEPTEQKAADVETPENDKDPAVAELVELRAKAEAAGINVKGTWGKKRILMALEDKAAETLTAETPADKEQEDADEDAAE